MYVYFCFILFTLKKITIFLKEKKLYIDDQIKYSNKFNRILIINININYLICKHFDNYIVELVLIIVLIIRKLVTTLFNTCHLQCYTELEIELFDARRKATKVNINIT